MTTVGRWLLATVLAGGCATDLLVGEDVDGGSTGGTAAADDGASAATTSADTGGDPSGPDTSTTAVDPSDGGSTTGGVDPSTTSTGPGETTATEGGGSSTGEPVGCGDLLDMGPCVEQAGCVWIGGRIEGECVVDPCRDPGNECAGFGYADCVDTTGCAWSSADPEMGDCAPVQCVPCELLDEAQCLEVRDCDYNGRTMVCAPL